MAARHILRAVKSKPTLEGAGVKLRRAFGFQGVEDTDPFLLLDDFRGEKAEDFIKGFPWHPHRGIETITYMLEGSVEHGDSIGNSGVIKAGGVQWMTAGSGIIHQEMPKPGKNGRMGGFQLWSNLPAKKKMMPPRYQEFTADQIPVVGLENGIDIRIVCGSFAGIPGPVEGVESDPGFYDITMPPGMELGFKVTDRHTLVAYVFEGEAWFEERRDPFAYPSEGEKWIDTDPKCLHGNHTLIIYKRRGDAAMIKAGENGVRFLLCTGKPLDEPVAWYGPIVMNTQEELRTAFKELNDDTFLKHGR